MDIGRRVIGTSISVMLGQTTRIGYGVIRFVRTLVIAGQQELERTIAVYKGFSYDLERARERGIISADCSPLAYRPISLVRHLSTLRPW